MAARPGDECMDGLVVRASRPDETAGENEESGEVRVLRTIRIGETPVLLIQRRGA